MNTLLSSLGNIVS